MRQAASSGSTPTQPDTEAGAHANTGLSHATLPSHPTTTALPQPSPLAQQHQHHLGPTASTSSTLDFSALGALCRVRKLCSLMHGQNLVPKPTKHKPMLKTRYCVCHPCSEEQPPEGSAVRLFRFPRWTQLKATEHALACPPPRAPWGRPMGTHGAEARGSARPENLNVRARARRLAACP